MIFLDEKIYGIILILLKISEEKVVNSRTNNSIKNAVTAVLVRVLMLFIGFFSRTFFIKYLGEDCLGLNGLFTTILSLLSLAELGISEAITFYLYKPIAEKDDERLRALIQFYKKIYRIIGCVILISGIALTPLLPKIVNFNMDIQYNIYIVYFLYLSNSAITYLFFSYPQSVLNANQKQYIISVISIVFSGLTFVFDLVAMILVQNFIAYLVFRLVLQLIQNIIIYIIAKKKYPYITECSKQGISKNEFRNMIKDVYGIFIIRISAKLFDSTDNIFISKFLGTILVGYNSNYLMFYNASISIVNSIIYSVGASVGDYNATHNKEDTLKLFYRIDALNFIFTFLFTIGFLSMVNPFISKVWGENFLFSSGTVILMCTNYYIVSSLNTVFMFRQSLGVFRKNKYNQLVAAIINIILDFLLIRDFGILGLYLATVLSEILFAFFPFITSLFKVGFKCKSSGYIISILIRMAFTIMVGVIICMFLSSIPDTWFGIFLRLIWTIFMISTAYLILYFIDFNIKEAVRTGVKYIRKR